MASNPPDRHYQRALEFIASADWCAAEGCLLRARAARASGGVVDLELTDALAYVLLMQGEFQAVLTVLTPVLDAPGRSFWIHHKQADAFRGLHQAAAAVRHYRQALIDGSDSPLTSRNLLQVLHGEDPALALAELERWLPLPGPRLEGAREAAMLVAGLELAHWLQARGLANPALQRRLAEQQLYHLQPVQKGWFTTSGGDGDAAWLAGLQRRLQGLGLLEG